MSKDALGYWSQDDLGNYRFSDGEEALSKNALSKVMWVNDVGRFRRTYSQIRYRSWKPQRSLAVLRT